MSRGLILLVLSGVALAAPVRPAKIGEWGEDPRVVPDFAPMEERRAPKMPGADSVWTQLQPERSWDALEGALFVCRLQIGATESPSTRGARAIFSLGTSELRRTNATVRLVVGSAAPIMLWGPLFHDASYVSIPALALHRGDRLTMSLSDRKLMGEKALGRVAVTWDGRSPLVFTTPAWTARCALTDAADALHRAQPWLESIDRQLALLAAAKPSRDAPELGRPTQVLTQLRGAFADAKTHEGNFRYAAGFLGWGAPQIQERIQKMRDLVSAFDHAATDEVRALVSSLQPAPLPLGDSTATLKRKGNVITLHIAPSAPVRCADLVEAINDVELVDESGHFYESEATIVDHKHQHCDGLHATTLLQPPIDATLSAIVTKTGSIVLLHTKQGFALP